MPHYFDHGYDNFKNVKCLLPLHRCLKRLPVY